MSTSWWHRRRSQRIIKVSRIRPLEIMNVCESSRKFIEWLLRYFSFYYSIILKNTTADDAENCEITTRDLHMEFSH